jgi:hypothetical protein
MKVNTSVKSTAEQAKALADKIDPVNLDNGQKVVAEGNARYIVETINGLSVRTRIA